jgi:hypothetical protein
MNCNDYEFRGWIFDDYERLAEIRFGFVPEHYLTLSEFVECEPAKITSQVEVSHQLGGTHINLIQTSGWLVL